MRIGILTGGGDCPGLNAVIRAVTRKGLKEGWEIWGILEGWRGLMGEGWFEPLRLDSVSGILRRGGTVLRTSRDNPFKIPNGAEEVLSNIKKNKIDALIAVGGEGTMKLSKKFFDLGIPLVGVPKTIDNDIWGTDVTFGYDTALNTAMEVIDKLHSTAESHNRVLVVEVMGHYTGWIAWAAGLASGADLTIIPEHPTGLKEICEVIEARFARGKYFSIVVVAEGAKISLEKGKPGDYIWQPGTDASGHPRLGGIGEVLARKIEEKTGFEARPVTLGYIQRGGSPSAFDRVLASRFGVFAVEMIQRGKFGCMAALKGTEIIALPLEEATKQLKTVPVEYYKTAEVFFG